MSTAPYYALLKCCFQCWGIIPDSFAILRHTGQICLAKATSATLNRNFPETLHNGGAERPLPLAHISLICQRPRLKNCLQNEYLSGKQ
jgi:hypothetical protein